VLKRKKTVSWWCIFGAVVLSDQVWSSAKESYLRPLHGRVGVSARGKSRRLQRVLTDFGCEHSFARAVKSQVIAETDGTMICTVAAGLRTDHRPRKWKEIRFAHLLRPHRVRSSSCPSRAAKKAGTFGSMITATQSIICVFCTPMINGKLSGTKTHHNRRS
jgi:hypothetical protein